jgi:peroxiredoxin
VLLRDRSADLVAAGLRVIAISMDAHWSHRAWAQSLRLGDTVELLSDRIGDATRGFDVLGHSDGMPRATRSVFLLRGDTVVASWLPESGMVDVDAFIASASSS